MDPVEGLLRKSAACCWSVVQTGLEGWEHWRIEQRETWTIDEFKFYGADENTARVDACRN